MSESMERWQGKIENIASQIISRDGRHGDHIEQICELRKELIFSATKMTGDERELIGFQLAQLENLRRNLLELSWANEL